jgi:outer membrane protein TolC/ABC-type transporter Mla MlaB component
LAAVLRHRHLAGKSLIRDGFIASTGSARRLHWHQRGRRNTVLRITVHEDDACWRLQLEGTLTTTTVAAAAETWTSAPVRDRRVVVDLTGVTTVDREGWALLKAMHLAGARFEASGVETKALLGEMRRECAAARSRAVKAAGVTALAIVLSAATVCAQDAAAPLRLTLRDAVSVALQQNPQVAIANLGLLRSEEDRRIARADLLPSVSVSASERVQRSNTQTFFGSSVPGFPGHVGPFSIVDAGPQLSAPVFDLSLWHRWQAARHDARAAAAEVSTAREQNAELVVSQYLGGLRAAAGVDAARARLDLAQALLDLATDLQNTGVGTSIDTLRANVEYQNERQRYTEAVTAKKIALYGLARLLNVAPDRTIELADTASFFETPEVSAPQTLVAAYRDRPELKAIAARLDAAASARRAARDAHLPTVSVGGRWSLEGLSADTAIPVYAYQASIDVPLFTGGRIEAQSARAAIDLRQLEQRQIDTRNQVALEVNSAIAELEAGRTEVEAARLGVSLADESVRQAQDRFRAGVANNIEVITAQNDLARANDNEITALYRYNQSRADLARATGRMEATYSH